MSFKSKDYSVDLLTAWSIQTESHDLSGKHYNIAQMQFSELHFYFIFQVVKSMLMT